MPNEKDIKKRNEVSSQQLRKFPLRRHGHNTAAVIGAPTGSGTYKVEVGIFPHSFLHLFNISLDLSRFTHLGEHIMSTNRPFLANFLAAFRAQSTYKATSQPVGSGGTSSLSTAQISQSARAIATKAASSAQAAGSSSSGSGSGSASHHSHHNHHTHSSSTSASATGTAGPVQGPAPAPAHHYHHATAQADSSLPSSPPTTPASSTPIPINRGPADRQRRGSDSSSGSGGFRDAIGPEKWYIGGRTPAGEERFYRLGMVTKGGGRLGGSGRVGSIDQLSL
jgi:hypothetical protein